jgi:predicted DNA-binding transcriptional regulator AlpA
MSDSFFSPKDLARRWGVSTRTLDRWRRVDQGPKYLKLGWLVAYRKADVLEFEEQQTRTPANGSVAATRQT